MNKIKGWVQPFDVYGGTTEDGEIFMESISPDAIRGEAIVEMGHYERRFMDIAGSIVVEPHLIGKKVRYILEVVE
jgi:hypothetical protein